MQGESSVTDDLIRQLSSADASVRRKAIIALGKSKDAAALRSLADVYRGDPVPELRELARKAGVYIRQSNPSSGSSAASRPAPRSAAADLYTAGPLEDMPDPELPDYSYLYDEPDPAPAPEVDTRRVRLMEEEAPAPKKAVEDSRIPIRGREYNVPKHMINRAKQYVDSALSLNIEGNNAKALNHLTEALTMNPNLINDAYFSNVAAAVTGAGGDEAIALIVNRDSRKQMTEQAQKEYKKQKVDEHLATVTSSWGDLWWEVILFSLINGLGPIFMLLVTAESALNLVNTMGSAQGGTGSTAPELAIV